MLTCGFDRELQFLAQYHAQVLANLLGDYSVHAVYSVDSVENLNCMTSKKCEQLLPLLFRT